MDFGTLVLARTLRETAKLEQVKNASLFPIRWKDTLPTFHHRKRTRTLRATHRTERLGVNGTTVIPIHLSASYNSARPPHSRSCSKEKSCRAPTCIGTRPEYESRNRRAQSASESSMLTNRDSLASSEPLVDCDGTLRWLSPAGNRRRNAQW